MASGGRGRSGRDHAAGRGAAAPTAVGPDDSADVGPTGASRRTAPGAGAGHVPAPEAAPAEGPDDEPEVPRGTGLSGRMRIWRSILSTAPLSFLGLGVYRAWIEIAFVGSFVDYPTQHFAGHDAFDLVMVVTLFVFAALHARLTPLHERRWSKPTGVALLVLATVGGFASIWHPSLAPLLAWPCAVFGGVGIAIVILLWSELYACESPVRICLLYSLSLVTGALVIYVYRGFVLAWLPAMVCLLPVVSIACLTIAYRGLSRERRPARVAPPAFVFPWKPIAVVAIYCSAFGLQEIQSYSVFGPHSAPGMVACALVVVAAIVMLSGRVEFQTIYGTWLPFFSAVFLMLPVLISTATPLGRAAFDLSVNFGYAASEIFVMTMIGSICYHYGASAIWLFGIERGVRALSMVASRWLAAALAGVGIPVAPFVMVAVFVATFMVFSEKRLDSTWGVLIQGTGASGGPDAPGAGDGEGAGEVVRRNALVRRCSDLARRYGLTQREEEVLILLAEHKTAGDIERELLIANGTAKAHIGHVYQKLGIHSREELFEVAGVEGAPGSSEGRAAPGTPADPAAAPGSGSGPASGRG